MYVALGLTLLIKVGILFNYKFSPGFSPSYSLD